MRDFFMQHLSQRPDIKVALTKADKRNIAASKLTLLLCFVLPVVSFTFLPETIPSHFNLKGEVDGYSNRLIIFILPIVGLFVFGLLRVVADYPQMHNYLNDITKDNAAFYYGKSVRFLNRLALYIAVLFLFIEAETIYSALYGKVFMPWLMIASIILFTVFTIYTAINAGTQKPPAS